MYTFIMMLCEMQEKKKFIKLVTSMNKYTKELSGYFYYKYELRSFTIRCTFAYLYFVKLQFQL